MNKMDPNREKTIRYNVGRAVDSFVAAWKGGKAPRIVRPEGYHLRDLVSSDMVQKTVAQVAALGAELGQEEVALVGDSIYDSLTNASFPKVLDSDEFIGGEVVYAEIPEGAEIPHGSVVREVGPGLVIKKYAALFEITEEVQEYNEDWVVEAKSKALGVGYRKMLNHVRMFPIVSYKYENANKTAAVYKDASGNISDNSDYEYYKSLYATLSKGLDDAADAGRPASVVLCHSKDAKNIKAVMDGYRENNGIQMPALGITSIEVYDGDSAVVRGETFTFTGVTAGKCYLIRPYKGFFERIRKPLAIGLGDADASRGILNEIIGKAYMGHYVCIANNVQEVTLP